jgi:hypothetical protein
MSVKPIPPGFNSVSCYLVVKGVTKAIDFYATAFGAKPGAVMKMPDGKTILHAEICIGNSMVMLTEENPQWEMKSSETLGGSPPWPQATARDRIASPGTSNRGSRQSWSAPAARWGSHSTAQVVSTTSRLERTAPHPDPIQISPGGSAFDDGSVWAPRVSGTCRDCKASGPCFAVPVR